MANPVEDADDAQLEVWAFGRQGRVTDRELAEAALRELIRRGELRAAAERERASVAPEVAPAPTEGDSTVDTDENADDAAATHDQHRQRMRTTGLTGLAAAALTLLGVAPLLMPVGGGGDPLAVFERPATAEDEAWVDRLTRDYVSGVTLGPRAIELDEGLSAAAFRAAATIDGRSTAFDPYCLFVLEAGPDGTPVSMGGTCVTPEQFAAEGLGFVVRPSRAGGEFDIVSWGPTGDPRLRSNQSLPTTSGVSSVLDWLVFPVVDGILSPATIVGDDREDLLMGPSVIPLAADGEVPALTTWAYLRAGAEDEPVLCMATLSDVPVEDGDTPALTRTCSPLDAVRRLGIGHSVTADGAVWQVLIGPDGDGRSDRVQPAEGPQQ